MDVGFLSGEGEAGKADGAAESIDDSGNFGFGFGFGCGQWTGSDGRGDGDLGRDLDRLAAESAMMGFQGAGLVGKPLPSVVGGPRESENVMGEDAHGVEGLPELPIAKVGGAAKGVEEGGGSVGGMIATGLDPSLGPAEVILVGGGPDGQRVEALEEAQARRGEWLTVRRGV